MAQSPATHKLGEGIPGSVLIIDPAGLVLYASDEALDFFGTDRVAIEGRNVESLVGDEIRPNSETTVSLPVEITRPDGSVLPSRVSFWLMTLDGEELGVVLLHDRSGEVETEADLLATRNRLAEAERVSQRGSWEWNTSDSQVNWSDQMYRVFGFEIGGTEATYESYVGRIHPDDRQSVIDRIGLALRDGRPWEDIKRAFKADGSEFLLATQGSVVTDDEGRPLRLIGVCGDVTAVVEAEGARSHLAAVVDSSINAMASLDLEGRFVSFSPGAEALLGYRAADMVGKLGVDVLPERQTREVLGVIESIKAGNYREEYYEARRTRPDGTEFDISAGASPVFDSEGELIGVSVIARDITAQKQAAALLTEYASKDMLTGLLNRRCFLEELELSLDSRADGPSMGAVLMLDLDNFKYVNDAHGHNNSDELLRNVARIIEKELESESATLARLGGDEFALLLPGASGDSAVQIANRLLKLLRGNSLIAGRTPITITTSIGIAYFTSVDRDTAGDILADADRALYEAKDNGRDRYHVATRHREPTQYESRLDWEDRIRKALASDGFVLHLQPILDLRTSDIAMFEVLLRMNEGGELVQPGAFLGIAERHGLIHEIDRWVVNHSFDLLESDRDLRLSVNVSAQSLDDEELLEIIRDRLASGLIEVENLVIEVTETTAIVNLERAHDFATAIREMGCGFALDDFGTGFGSFAYLKRIPAAYLKIDGEFVATPRSRTDDCVIEAIVQLARGLDKKTIAEYVEDEETLIELTRAGVDYAQGFHIGRPGPIDEILQRVPSA